MTIELIKAAELRASENGPGKQGRIGVLYQVQPTGEFYRWDGVKHVAVAGAPGSGSVDAASVQAALSSDQPGGRTALGLGTAATQPATAFLTPAQRPEVATWGDLPAANSVTVGSTYTVLNTGWRVYSDGANWRPANGRLLIAQRCGSVASPLATLTGVTAGPFVLPVVPTVPAMMLFAGARVIAEAVVRRTTGTATATLAVRFGTTGSAGDSVIYSNSMPATANNDARVFSTGWFTGASAMTVNNTSAVNGLTTSGTQDRAANINIGSAMSMSIDMAAANASDSFSLLYYMLAVEG